MSGTKLFKHEKPLWEEQCNLLSLLLQGCANLVCSSSTWKATLTVTRTAVLTLRNTRLNSHFYRHQRSLGSKGDQYCFGWLMFALHFSSPQKPLKQCSYSKISGPDPHFHLNGINPFFSPHKSTVYLSACSVHEWRLILSMTLSLLNLCLVNLYY